MNELVIADTIIHQDAVGRYCLNDLHRASGGNLNHRPGEWLRNKQAQELVAELGDAGISASAPVTTIKGGDGAQGTYAAKELVYAYAMWISAAFHLKVIRAYDAMVSAPPQTLNPTALSRMQLIELAMQAEQERLALEHKVGELAPKAEALDRFATFAEGSMCISNAAKALQMQPKVFFRWLQQHEWIFRRAGGSGWLAYQARIQVGYLEHKVTTVERGDGTEKVVEQVLVTAKGLAKLSQLLSEPVTYQPPGGAARLAMLGAH